MTKDQISFAYKLVTNIINKYKTNLVFIFSQYPHIIKVFKDFLDSENGEVNKDSIMAFNKQVDELVTGYP